MNLITFKIIILIFTFAFSSFSTASDSTDKINEAFFSPRQGKVVFDKMYAEISSAKKEILLTLYSWTDFQVKDALEQALKNGAIVKVVLHPPLYRDKAKIQSWVKELEALGADFKVAKMNMHEKFYIIDNKILMNSSANMSSGPKSTYSENWIFHYINEKTKNIFQDFSHEFAVLWNTSSDIQTNNEKNADIINFESIQFENGIFQNIPNLTHQAPLFSSSMNFTIKLNKPSSKDFQSGKFWKMVKRKVDKKQTWLVKDEVLRSIHSAKTSISCAFNHLFIPEIATALVSASKRGVDVKLAVDNQEYTGGETKLFVKQWLKIQGNRNKIPPVRVKTYSHKPSFMYWRLNHHKYCLIDYKTPNVVLLNGSYNFSETAEHKQFDNQVFYRGEEFNQLYDDFFNDFNILYFENRTKDDLPDQNILDKFFATTEYGAYPIHISDSIALTWYELRNLRSKINKLAPGILRTPNQKRHCMYYKYIQQDDGSGVSKYYGCPQ